MSMLFRAITLTLFVLFVLPVWLWLHYNNRGANGSLTQNEQQRLLQLTDDAKRMRERIQALEAIHAGIVPFDKIVTTYPLEQGVEVFEAMKRGRIRVLKWF